MIIIIDGYNLLKQRYPGIYVEDSNRNQLIRILGVYHKKRGHEIMLVFDGGVSSWPIKENKSGIAIIYAGYGKSADDYIKAYIAEHHNADLFLVSSDRDIAHWASKHDIASIDSLPFFDIIMEKLSHKEQKIRLAPAVKTTTREDRFLDELMEQASRNVFEKDEGGHGVVDKKQQKQPESKIDRLLRKKVEKL